LLISFFVSSIGILVRRKVIYRSIYNVVFILINLISLIYLLYIFLLAF
jgi:hypothetical protein